MTISLTDPFSVAARRPHLDPGRATMDRVAEGHAAVRGKSAGHAAARRRLAPAMCKHSVSAKKMIHMRSASALLLILFEKGSVNEIVISYVQQPLLVRLN